MTDILNAHSPRWETIDKSAILLQVRFSHLAEEVPFSACHDDPVAYGRELYVRAAFGEFGPIAEYVTPTPYAIASSENPPLRQQRLAQAGAMVQRWDILGNAVQADAWRDYYRALYALAESEIWPMVGVWPQEPSAMTGSVQIQELE
ncbi:phage tail protein [Aeromonas enteropelogenes]|uniref:phage tail protein n=1 Tax=Aeromonas enteropelogenes TaxID=29489 RepID=UPI003B9F6FB2